MDLNLVNNYGLHFDSILQSLFFDQSQLFLWASILKNWHGKIQFPHSADISGLINVAYYFKHTTRWRLLVYVLDENT